MDSCNGAKGLVPVTTEAPVPARTAKELYSLEFIRALTGAPGLTGPVSKKAANNAASTSWLSAEASVKAKYEERAMADKKRSDLA
jgi:hypothetical protein